MKVSGSGSFSQKNRKWKFLLKFQVEVGSFFEVFESWKFLKSGSFGNTASSYPAAPGLAASAARHPPPQQKGEK
jgi:hypothetical protein